MILQLLNQSIEGICLRCPTLVWKSWSTFSEPAAHVGSDKSFLFCILQLPSLYNEGKKKKKKLFRSLFCLIQSSSKFVEIRSFFICLWMYRNIIQNHYLQVSKQHTSSKDMIRRPVSLAVSFVDFLQLPKHRQRELSEMTQPVWDILTGVASITQDIWKTNNMLEWQLKRHHEGPKPSQP